MLVPVQRRTPRLTSEETGAEITVGGRGGGAGGDGEGGAYDTAPLSGARGVRGPIIFLYPLHTRTHHILIHHHYHINTIYT